MEAAIDVRGAFFAEKILWYCYCCIFSGVIRVDQSLGIVAVRAYNLVRDAILGLCVDGAVRQVRVDLLSIIEIVFLKTIRDLLLICQVSMEVSRHVFVTKDIVDLAVRSTSKH